MTTRARAESSDLPLSRRDGSALYAEAERQALQRSGAEVLLQRHVVSLRRHRALELGDCLPEVDAVVPASPPRLAALSA